MWSPEILEYSYLDSASIPEIVITFTPTAPEPVDDPDNPGSTITPPTPTVTHYTSTTGGTTPPQLVRVDSDANTTVSCPALNDVLPLVIKWVDVSDTSSAESLVYDQTTSWSLIPPGMKLYEFTPPNPITETWTLVVTAHLNDNASDNSGTDTLYTEVETYTFTTEYSLDSGTTSMKQYLAENP
ncbi:hypothetical protein NVP1031O_163 [Vibrio phage 1.031.O._10N.261.46.F8]|nr:hypothetical protein NVP1031O_163 [Vibrio phage 1.031.O._10N.261.46.F8]